MAQLQAIDFIICEVLHDELIIPVSDLSTIGARALLNNLAHGCKLDEGILTDLDNYRTFGLPTAIPSTLYPTSYMANNKHIGEENLVFVMFGHTKDNLKTAVKYLSGTFNMKQVMVKISHRQAAPTVANPQNVSFTTVPRQVRMYYYDQIRFQSTFPNNIMRFLFNSGSSYIPNPGGGVPTPSNDIYFVCDAASRLIKAISLSTNLPPNRHYHCMFSSSTFGDPAKLITPFSPTIVKRMKQNGIYKYTHIFNDPTIQSKGRCNRFTLLPITVTHTGSGINVVAGAVGQPPYSVNKTLVHANHKYKNTGIKYDNLTFVNSTKSTSRDAVVAKINLILGNQAGSMYKKLWYAQGKRLGDHEQVAFADWLINHPNAINMPTTVNRIQTGINRPMVDGNVYPAFPGMIARNLVTNPITLPCRSNVYYVTVDWPAFCFAVFNNISAILITMPTKGYIIAQFN